MQGDDADEMKKTRETRERLMAMIRPEVARAMKFVMKEQLIWGATIVRREGVGEIESHRPDGTLRVFKIWGEDEP